MSFGTLQKSDILEKAIHDAREAGIVVVASAGNEGEKGVDYPGAYEDTIAVGAIDHHAEIPEFSSVGEEVDVVAPGAQIGVETMFGMHTWADGTSMAAPHVTAEVGALIANGDEHDVDFWRGLITETSKSIEGEDTGVIDVEEALKQYDTYDNEYADECNEDILTKNISEIPVFSDEDVSFEGKWSTFYHNEIYDTASEKTNAKNYLSQNELNVMKKGSLYPDSVKYVGNDNKKHHVFALFWHGQYYSSNHDIYINYISSYRFLTYIAAYAGDTNNMDGENVIGLTKSQKNSIKSKITANYIYGEGKVPTNWENVLGSFYTGLSKNLQARMKRSFLYGMALHQATDTFAHSTYTARDKKSYIGHEIIGVDSNKNELKRADQASICPNRFTDAKAAAQRTINLYLNYRKTGNINDGIGTVEVFKPAKENIGKPEGYYLANVMQYAQEVNDGTSNDKIVNWFIYIFYDNAPAVNTD